MPNIHLRKLTLQATADSLTAWIEQEITLVLNNENQAQELSPTSQAFLAESDSQFIDGQWTHVR